MNEINEIKLPKGVESISVTQHDDKIVIEFIPEKPKFKEGDFVYEDGRIMIVKNYPNSYHALIYPELDMRPAYNRMYAPYRPLSSLSFRYATEGEKQLLIDAMKKDGKCWNAEKLIVEDIPQPVEDIPQPVEDIPQPKFKAGDKVKIKDGISSKTHSGVNPGFVDTMDKFIGKELTVKEYSSRGWVVFYEDDRRYGFSEDWLEPYEELKEGDLAIFWDNVSRHYASVRIFGCLTVRGYCDINGVRWDNAIKFESKEQFEKVLRGEI